MKKSFLIAAVAVSALFAGAAAAQDTSVSFNAAVTSNYVWRGMTQTDGNGALQAGADLKKGTFYAGTWLSNVDFGTNDSLEYDLYAGITPSVGDYSFDFGVISYMYDGDTDTTTELKAAVSHSIGAGTIGGAMYVNADTLEDPYYEVNMSYPVLDKLALSGAIGNYEAAGYTTYNIGATYSINDNFGLDLRYSEASKSAGGKPYLAATLKAAF